MSDNIKIYNADSAIRYLKTTDLGSDVHVPHHIIDSMPAVAVSGTISTDGLTDTQLRATPVPVSMSSVPLPTGAATSANQTNGLQKAQVTAFPDTAKCSFGRLRTSNPGFRFDAQLTYQVNADVWDTQTTTGSVTHSATERWATLSANASGTNSAILQSHYHAPYTPGRGQLAFITFLMGGAPATGGYKRAGYFDGTNGIYLERTDSAVNLVSKSSTSHGTETIPQASWNIDPLTGSGPSGLTLDLTKVQILVIQFQALYVGRVVVAFDIGGNIVPVHQFMCANEDVQPYIAQASLPVRYEVGGTASTGTPTTLNAVCASVISEGGLDLAAIQGREFSVGNGVTSVTTSTRRACLSIRNKAQLNSINQNALVIPLVCGIIAKTNDAFVEIVRNGTLGGTPSWANVDTTYSTMEYDVAGTTVTGGVVVDSFYVLAGAGSARGISDRGIGGKAVLAYSHLLGTADVLSVVVTPLTGSTSVNANMTWKEIR